MADAVFTINAMQLISELLDQGANINKIRAALHIQDGVWYKDDALVMAAAELGKHLNRINAGGSRTEVAAIIRLHKPKEPAPVDKVGLVKPGTFKVPVGGYKMGRT